MYTKITNKIIFMFVSYYNQPKRNELERYIKTICHTCIVKKRKITFGFFSFIPYYVYFRCIFYFCYIVKYTFSASLIVNLSKNLSNWFIIYKVKLCISNVLCNQEDYYSFRLVFLGTFPSLFVVNVFLWITYTT